MQNDYCAAGGRSHSLGRDIGPAQAIVPAIRRVFAAARAHGVPVIHVCMRSLPGGASDSPAWRAKRESTGLLGLCEEGTWGEEVIEPLSPQPGDIVVRKHRYSAFKRTDLETVLRALGRDTVIVTGMATNTCVESTVRDAFELDYFCVVVEDAVAGFSPQLHEATLANVRARFGEVLRSDELFGG